MGINQVILYGLLPVACCFILYFTIHYAVRSANKALLEEIRINNALLRSIHGIDPKSEEEVSILLENGVYNIKDAQRLIKKLKAQRMEWVLNNL